MIKRSLCYFCLAAGVLGLVLPVIPGIPLLLIGLRLLDRDHWLARRAAFLTGNSRNTE